jgi:hypothetical protein
MLKGKQKVISQIILVVFLIFTPLLVNAAGLVPCGGDGEKPCQIIDIFVIVARVTNWLLRVAGIFATFKIVQAGFWLAVSQGNEEDVTTNKKKFTNAVLGLALAMMAFMFVNTVVNVIFLQGLSQNRHTCKIDLTKAWVYVQIQPDACRK